jgi:hypothetical protein
LVDSPRELITITHCGLIEINHKRFYAPPRALQRTLQRSCWRHDLVRFYVGGQPMLAIWAKGRLLHRANPDLNGATYTAMRTDGTVVPVPNHRNQGEVYVCLDKASQGGKEGD